MSSRQVEENGLFELTDAHRENIEKNSLYSEDLKPIAIGERTWSKKHIASLWAGMSICIPTYTLSSG
nr:nitrate reductase [Candidatus Wallbacteria bacterium]